MADDAVPPMDFGKKKKKSKNPLALASETPAAAAPAAAPEVEKVADEFNDTAFFEKKKKKKKTIDVAKQLEGGDGTAGAPMAVAQGLRDSVPASASTSEVTPAITLRYTYEELLQRIFEQLIAKNPDLATDVKKKLKMPPPLMARVGTKKTQFTNFTIICKSFNRDPSHLSAFLFAELGTTGSIDANGALIIRGKYLSKHIEPLLQGYARTYVKCSTCGSHETVLSKDARLLFLICNKCSSKVTVKNVTSGFQAVTDKRAAIRAKAQ